MTRSSTDFPIGPIEAAIVLNVVKLSGSVHLHPLILVLVPVGLKPLTPLKAQGILILPPISDPSEIGAHLEAIIPPSPPELPPQDLVLSHGFYAQPHT